MWPFSTGDSTSSEELSDAKPAKQKKNKSSTSEEQINLELKQAQTWNRMNELEEEIKSRLRELYPVEIEFISAKSLEHTELLRSKLRELISRQYMVRYPYRSKH